MLKLGIIVEHHPEPNQHLYTATPVFVEGEMTFVASELTGLYTVNELEETLEVYEFFREELDKGGK